MDSGFTVEEKKKWLLKKHLKDHAFEYMADILFTMLFAYLLLRLCKAEDILLGLILSLAWALGRIVNQIRIYKREYINTLNK